MSPGRRDAGAFVERRLLRMLNGEAVGRARPGFAIGEHFHAASRLVILGESGFAEGVGLRHPAFGGDLVRGGQAQGGDKCHVFGGAHGEGAPGTHEVLEKFAASGGVREGKFCLLADPDGGGEAFPGPQLSQRSS